MKKLRQYLGNWLFVHNIYVLQCLDINRYVLITRCAFGDFYTSARIKGRARFWVKKIFPKIALKTPEFHKNYSSSSPPPKSVARPFIRLGCKSNYILSNRYDFVGSIFWPSILFFESYFFGNKDTLLRTRIFLEQCPYWGTKSKSLLPIRPLYRHQNLWNGILSSFIVFLDTILRIKYN